MVGERVNRPATLRPNRTPDLHEAHRGGPACPAPCGSGNTEPADVDKLQPIHGARLPRAAGNPASGIPF
jgi:hypothetical protein